MMSNGHSSRGKEMNEAPLLCRCMTSRYAA